MSIGNREKLPKSCWRAREDNLEINTCHIQSIKRCHARISVVWAPGVGVLTKVYGVGGGGIRRTV